MSVKKLSGFESIDFLFLLLHELGVFVVGALLPL
jgi:hypothetical protein